MGLGVAVVFASRTDAARWKGVRPVFSRAHAPVPVRRSSAPARRSSSTARREPPLTAWCRHVHPFSSGTPSNGLTCLGAVAARSRLAASPCPCMHASASGQRLSASKLRTSAFASSRRSRHLRSPQAAATCRAVFLDPDCTGLFTSAPAAMLAVNSLSMAACNGPSTAGAAVSHGAERSADEREPRRRRSSRAGGGPPADTLALNVVASGAAARRAAGARWLNIFQPKGRQCSAPLKSRLGALPVGGAAMALKPGAWLVGAAFLPVVSAWARAGDRQALRTLYEQMGGEHWAQDPELFGSDPYMAQNWTGGNNFWNVIDPVLDPTYAADPCQEKLTSDGLIADWFGVSCEDPCYAPIDGDDCRFGRITSIHLPGNNLTGTIPWQIFDSLVNLTIVDFSHNDISGTIPTEVGKLRNIKCA